MTTIAPPPPAPTPSTPSPLSPGGRTAIRAFLVIAASVVVVGSLVALGVSAWGLSNFRVVADETSLPGDTRSLVIDTRDVPAALRITTDRDATEPRISTRLINSSRAGERSLEVTRNGADTRVALTGTQPGVIGWGRAGEVTVTLPPEMARRLSLTTQQGAGVLMMQADVDTLVANNENGAVVLRGSARRIEVRTQDAEIVTRDPISVTESFLADSVDGDVSVDFGAAPRTVDASSNTGDVVVLLPDPGPYLVRASGDSAQVRVSETEDPDRAAAEVTVRSDDGTAVVDRLGSERHDRMPR
ncbi:hypothetical protein MARA_56560 [Mycolicibacterium arabiense]|uniref:Adhesin domain-containing protein n=1 Tax=Mycolicibacterium arabiense TaxID=1286181 RepID=A0A7I7S5T9_9MYCO|nr:hypothetical protein [Mycolicibacterium arabiense]MCV7372639.1 hypothetical protein [Mycolicibacterium arabiense]BBY52188.1 hypothetical protein MARA_56560 [Mycolicibacterium arabiense]